MKSKLLDTNGKEKKDIELPKIFSSIVREDIIKKVFEAEKTMQPYGPGLESGRKHSASGIIRHLRHVWKGGYGSGRSRIPRKIMWRRGSQFYWIGAEVSSTRGGRRAHGPKVAGMLGSKKINKKEWKIAFESGIAATISEKKVEKRYSRVDDVKIKLPIVVDSNITNLKSKELINAVEKLLGDLYLIARIDKKVRAGRGKLRNRKYKRNAGALIVVGNKEEIKTGLFDVKKVSSLEVKDLYPLGRLTIYTEAAISDLGGKKNDN